jgi:uncharacterized membrane protein
MNARAILLYVAATLVVAVAVHLGTVWYLPNLIMDRAMAQMGAVNTIHHGQRATAAIHGVVRPSPDLLYSVCPYDLSKGPLFISATVPPGTYWSVSLFDDATNNFYVRNDSQAKGSVALQVYYATMAMTEAPKLQRVRSPSVRGLVVFRTLVSDESKLAEIDNARRKVRCFTN